MKNSDKVLMEALHSALIGSLLQRIQEGTGPAVPEGQRGGHLGQAQRASAAPVYCPALRAADG